MRFYDPGVLKSLCEDAGYYYKPLDESEHIFLIYKRADNGATIVSGTLSTTPHCCGTLFLSEFRVLYPYHRKGFATELYSLIEKYAKQVGYSQLQYILPSSKCGYEHGNNLLKKLGFKRLIGSKFKNSRTDNIIYTWVKNISEGK